MAARIILRLRRQAALTPRQPPALLQKLDSRDLAIVLLGASGSAAIMVWAVAGAVATIVASFFAMVASIVASVALVAFAVLVTRCVAADIRRMAREDREFAAKWGGPL